MKQKRLRCRYIWDIAQLYLGRVIPRAMFTHTPPFLYYSPQSRTLINAILLLFCCSRAFQLEAKRIFRPKGYLWGAILFLLSMTRDRRIQNDARMIFKIDIAPRFESDQP